MAPPLLGVRSTFSNRRDLMMAMAASFALGLCGDILLRATPWGVNVGIWTALLAITSVLWARQIRVPLRRLWMVGPGALFAFCLAWRDSATLNNLSLGAAVACLLFALANVSGRRLADSHLMEWARGIAGAFGHCIAGIPNLTRNAIDFERRSDVAPGPARHVIKGLLLSAPFLILFGALFKSADQVFDNLVVDLFSFDIEVIASHLFVFVICAWMGGGYLMAILENRRDAIDETAILEESVPGEGTTAEGRLGAIEINTVLLMLNLLFLSFVAVQFQYLFSGGEWVRTNAELSWAQYARRGFFELVAVAALVLPMLLTADWLVSNPGRWFRILSLSLIGLLYIIILSALQRMQLYWEHFGLTELRVYTTAFMAWLALVFAWFIATVQRGRRRRFGFGAVGLGLGVIFALHVLNPDAFIARANLQRHREGRPLDLSYLLSLSADARPVLERALPGLGEMERSSVARALDEARLAHQTNDWRSWNWGRSSNMGSD